MKFFGVLALFVALLGMASAFVPSFTVRSTIMKTQARQTSLRMAEEEGEKELGAGGMADTRNPEPKDDPDPRKSISAAPSFEDYLKQKEGK
ncbi:unnamed protein product [Discosporangium mesarthrocarpum]